jgi:hypothetical protein
VPPVGTSWHAFCCMQVACAELDAGRWRGRPCNSLRSPFDWLRAGSPKGSDLKARGPELGQDPARAHVRVAGHLLKDCL